MKLTDICEFHGGSQPPKSEWSSEYKDGYIRMLQIRDFTQEGRVTPEYVKISNRLRLCTEDDILVGRYGASVGKILSGKSGAYNVAIMKAVPDTSVVRKQYLRYYFLSPNFQNYILNLGGRAAQAGFSKDDLARLEITVVSLEEQDKIVNELSTLEKTISTKQKQLKEFDDLVKSRFIEMFGDPVENPLGWKKVALSDVAEIKIGPFGSLLHKEDYIENGHPLVNPSHIIDGSISTDSKLSISDVKYAELNSYHLKVGDVVLGRRGEMGRCAVVKTDSLLCGTGSLIIRANEDVTSEFIQNIISFPSYKEYIEGMAIGQTMRNLNVPIVSNLQIIKPPLDVQKQYYDFGILKPQGVKIF